MRREIVGVDAGLDLNAGQRLAPLLRLHDADGLAVGHQQIVGFAGTGDRHLPDRDPAPGEEVDLLAVLDEPTGQLKLAVDVLTRELLQVRHAAWLVAVLRQCEVEAV